MTYTEMVVFSVSIITFGVLALAMITYWSRNRTKVGSADLQALNDRLAKIEQAVDAIAVEAERISEGQRFTTKLMSERTPARSEQR